MATEGTKQIAQTQRLRIRWMDTRDSGFVLELVNEPSWIRYIGDRGVKTLAEATRYIEDGAIRMYRQAGFGLYLVELKSTGEAIGICGLIKREALQDVDIGFAFLPRFWRKGYALEAAAAVCRTHETWWVFPGSSPFCRRTITARSDCSASSGSVSRAWSACNPMTSRSSCMQRRPDVMFRPKKPPVFPRRGIP
jgi:hypothetical protein